MAGVDRLQNKTLPQKSRREMKIIAEGKPIVTVAKVALPIEVRLALRIVPIHITRIGIAVERNV